MGSKVLGWSVKNYRGQDYATIKKDCVKTGRLFEDPEFPAHQKSIFFSRVDSEVQWKRPKELRKAPRLMMESMSCDDLTSGEQGTNWFVTACASLFQGKKIWEKVIPNYKEQEWDEKNSYVGMFRFNFWRYGQWFEVVIDDRLPTRNDKLIFCHPKSRNEFWPALLEKAYAKLFGDYESLTQRNAVEAMVDFTGGVAERLDIKEYDFNDSKVSSKMFEKLLDASANGAVLVGEIECTAEERDKELESGLVQGQGYILTLLKHVDVKKALQGALGCEVIHLIRLFNPWGSKAWTGPWSDGSAEWKVLAAPEWEKMGLTFSQEGEFWISFEDFVRHFTRLDICHFVSTSFFSNKKSWYECIFHGQWTASGRNGGGKYDSATRLLPDAASHEKQEGKDDPNKFIFKFLYNPQYLFDITGDEDKIMLSLEQHDVKGREALLGNMNVIGFHILKAEENRRYRVHVPGKKEFTSDYSNNRSVFGTVILMKGRYLILPTTKESGSVGQFMLRLYTTRNANARELTEEAPPLPCLCMFHYKCVTTITVLSCKEIGLPAGVKGSFVPYVKVICEGETTQSVSCKDTNNPVFNFSAIFYRKKPNRPIVIQIWNQNRVFDDFVAEAKCYDEGCPEEGEFKTLKLYGRKSDADTVVPGTMHIFVRTSSDVTLL